MQRIFTLLSALILLIQIAYSQLERPINTWKDFTSFRSLNALTESKNGVLAASDVGIFNYNLNDNSVSSITKVDGLSSTNISSMQYFPNSDVTFVGYQDGNIDIIDANAVISNIGDLFRSNLIGDKTINAFKEINQNIWVCTAIGILVIDPSTNFVLDTYRFGLGGTSIDVNDIELIADTVFAATESGLYKANINDPFLSNFQNWQLVDVPQAQRQIFNEIEFFQSKLYLNFNSGAWPNDVLLESSDMGQSFQVSNLISGFQCKALSSTSNKLLVSDLFSSSVFNENLEREQFAAMFKNEVIFINQALFKDGKVYQTTRENALLETNASNAQQSISPSGPTSNVVWQVKHQQGMLTLASGGVNQTHSSLFFKDGFSILNEDGFWENNPFNADLNGYFDALSIAVDPRDESHYYIGTYGTGLIEYRNNVFFQELNFSNSPLEERPQVAGATYPNYIEFDNAGNLWVINSFASRPVKILSTDGTWQEFEVDPATGNRNLFTFSSYDITSNNQLWITKFREGITVLDLGDLNTIEDDRSKFLSTTFNEGGLPSGDVKCLVEDKNGAIWGGSDKGIFIFFNPLNIFDNQELNAQQIFIEQDGNVQILLETEQVNDIYVDGGNRKWVATQNSGLFLFSDDGIDQIAVYNTANSPILSNAILSLSMNETTGELYVGTDKGLQSLQTDSKTPIFGEDLILTAYPNPVRDNYFEPIVFEGFASNSRFTITDANGNLIFRGLSNGGRATWNYTNQRNEEVSSGVYFIFAQDVDGLQSRKTKFLLFR